MTRHYWLTAVGAVLLLAALKLREFALVSEDPAALQPLVFAVVVLSFTFGFYSLRTR